MKKITKQSVLTDQRKVNRTFKTISFQRLHLGFTNWLTTLGYSKSTISGMPRLLSEFLHWLECQGHTEITTVTKKQVNAFLDYFENRPNQNTQQGLSINYVNKQIEALQKFFRYLKETGQVDLTIDLRQIKVEKTAPRTLLTQQEIKELYTATDNSLIGIRDRAMLSIYYGCGLRKSEGLDLELSDILFERRLLYVRESKNHHQRYVPMNVKCLQDLEAYIYSARPLLLDTTYRTETLFISERGKPLEGQAFKVRLQVLKERTANPVLQNKTFGLHALRHSIATHLLQAGMELENIALFLGHRSLDSTQIYTHIINEL